MYSCCSSVTYKSSPGGQRTAFSAELSAHSSLAWRSLGVFLPMSDNHALLRTVFPSPVPHGAYFFGGLLSLPSFTSGLLGQLSESTFLLLPPPALLSPLAEDIHPWFQQFSFLPWMKLERLQIQGGFGKLKEAN